MNAVATNRLAGHGRFPITALFGCEIDDHAAGFHLHHVGGDQFQPGLRDQRGRDDDVGILGLFGVHGALRGLEAFGHDLAVAAPAAAIFVVVDFDEFTAERFHLIGDFGARVVSARDGALRPAAVPMADRPATPAPAMKTCAGGNCRRRDLVGEIAAEGVGRFDDRAIAGDAGPARSAHPFFCARQKARNRVHGEDGDILGLGFSISSGFCAGQMKEIGA